MSNAVVTDWPSGSANTGWPQEPTGMLMPGRVQGWPAGTQRAANAAERLLSQAVAWWDVSQYRDGDRFLRNRGTGGELLDLRLGSSIAPNSNDPLFLAPEDTGYVYLPGVAGNYLSVPDEAALDITGDIDIRVKVALDDWTPGDLRYVAGKYTTTGNQRSYRLEIQSDGKLSLRWSADGTSTIASISTVATGISDGATKWLRATLDVDNGSSGNDVKFYLSDDGVAWTQLGSTVTTAGTTSIFASTTAFEVAPVSGSAPFAGSVYRAIVKNGIDGPTVLDIDCDAITSGAATSFTAVTNQTVTVNRSTSGRKSVCVPSRHKGGKPVMLLGSDDFLEVQDNWQHGLLNFGQGDSFTVLAVARQWATFTGSIIAKTISPATATDPGYVLYTLSTLEGVFYIKDGTTALFDSTAGGASGGLAALAAVRNTATDRLGVYLNGSVTADVADTTTGSLASTVPLRVGSRPNGTGYTGMEFYGAAIFRRALSAAEIKTISDYMTARIA